MKDVLGSSAILVGWFAFIGLLLQKKSLADTVSGMCDTSVTMSLTMVLLFFIVALFAEKQFIEGE
jgi:ascorbate-specific PTS system EIIC-type component UlaA